jgi:hypothetical protein
MKMFGWIIVIAIALYFFSKAKISAAVSAGNPNLPPSQSSVGIGPQGPNDGSNSYDGSGHTVYPLSGLQAPAQRIPTRGFVYTNAASQYGVRTGYPAY